MHIHTRTLAYTLTHTYTHEHTHTHIHTHTFVLFVHKYEIPKYNNLIWTYIFNVFAYFLFVIWPRQILIG